ncbi:hypothetical protein HMPREF0083_04371 [Aneurinibacillus aneurinilyticus ATCC 12856]|jgi:hypothetical protein|uniref:Uncharacterized protein n=1 Tax=Aneurinibacillus aneurinilyticus ATCC 12856 TaxID=649747 RepID=U1Y9T3_ANEAE|nr:hypothetical protein HMPREF0083_04371 [Aneurinibacillus aneurinilyticus ATCC 12856]
MPFQAIGRLLFDKQIKGDNVLGIDEINKNLQLHLSQNSMECLRLHARKQAKNELLMQ